MTGIKLLGCILKVRRILKIKRFSFQNWGKELHLWVKPYRNGCRCPQCSRRSRIKRTMAKERLWRDVRVCGIDVFFHYQPREIVSPTHGRSQEIIPWADTFSQVTYRFEALALRYCQSMAQKDVASLLHVSPSTLSGIIHRIIRRVRSTHKIRALRTIGVDEISYHKGRKFATIVYDLDKGCVVWVGRGKARKTIDEFFSSHLSAFQRKNIRYASCDMSKTYIGAIKQWCPNATLVLDRFHVVKALNESVDEVRKSQWRELKGTAEGKAIKGCRWLLFRHSSNRSKEDKQLLQGLRKTNHRIWRASVLKDEFESFWEYKSPTAAAKFLKRWETTALKSRLEPIRDFVRTLRNHKENILTFIGTRLTNAVAEGLNRIIRKVKNRASGFANLEAFEDLIYLTVGDVDILEQFSPQFCTF